MRPACTERARWPAATGAALCVLLLALASVVLSAAPARAHTALVSSTPASSAVVDDRLTSVQLQFDQPLSPRAAQVVVTGPDGSDVADGPASVSGATVTQPVRPLPVAGEHRLAFRVLAEDGHPVTGSTSFSAVLTVASPSPAVAGPSQAPPAADASDTGDSGQAASSASGAQGTGVGPALVAALSGLALVLAAGAARAGRRAGVGR